MVQVEILGENVDRAVSANFGDGITVVDFLPGDPKHRAALLNIDLHAKNGPRNVVFTDKEHKTLTLKGAVTVTGGEAADAKPAAPGESAPATAGAPHKRAKRPPGKNAPPAKRGRKTTS